MNCVEPIICLILLPHKFTISFIFCYYLLVISCVRLSYAQQLAAVYCKHLHVAVFNSISNQQWCKPYGLSFPIALVFRLSKRIMHDSFKWTCTGLVDQTSQLDLISSMWCRLLKDMKGTNLTSLLWFGSRRQILHCCGDFVQAFTLISGYPWHCLIFPQPH